MTRNELCKLLEIAPPAGLDFQILAVTEDSRRVQPGTVFVAVSGTHSDGHDFAAQAAASGASAIIGSRPELTECAGLPYLYTPSPRRAAGLLAHALAGFPSNSMTVIGITGTNGKSSTAYLVQTILNESGHSAANLGTLGYVIGGETIAAPHTTPFGEDLAALFARAKSAGHTHVVMEASSHALEQERVAGIEFDVAAFTNLTQDHLDFHQDMATYQRAKLRLFAGLEGEGKFGVVNLADPQAGAFMAECKVPCLTYGKGGDCRAVKVQMDIRGTEFSLKTPWGAAEARMRLVGKHNVANALCAVAIGGGLGIPLDRVVAGLAALPAVPGRFEAVDAGQDFFVIVDYAHTEDGLRNVLDTARGMCKGRVITVFGCGGDRDKTKRPKMGAAAAQLSDLAILTSDNPRSEDPHRILLDIEVGVQREGKAKGQDYLVIENREQAIRTAIGMARGGDLVMIAGKGHEDYQILGTRRIHFDDREMARAALEGR
jgi:UDP-N-acetylmuramoyl-L-alanyl-D-glutamate--2,6-diaminopimelate ligase